MLEIYSIFGRDARISGTAELFADDEQTLTRTEAAARVSMSAKAIAHYPERVGILAENGVEYAVAQLAAWWAGKTVVPLPMFFSAEQIGHIIRDANLTHTLVTPTALRMAQDFGLTPLLLPKGGAEDISEPAANGGQIIYTSGSTGRPKGVRLTIEQINKSATLLADATNASETDFNLALLPLPLLLETISAICVPLVARARTRFDRSTASVVASGRPGLISEAFARHRPTTSVLVPELLSAWVGDLERKKQSAPSSLRFIAVGGAPVMRALAGRAWAAGIPAHEGYGLSECCSVVSVNRYGQRRPETVGKPLNGVDVRIDNGEIIVRGPTVMQGYLQGDDVSGEWRTGDLGAIDEDGFLSVYGRKDNLLVTSYGRNVIPEWIESMLLIDPRISACGVVGHGESYLSVLLVPSAYGAAWLSKTSKEEVLLEIENLCRAAPPYAVPRDFIAIPREEAMRIGLFTANGRIKRGTLQSLYRALKFSKASKPLSSIARAKESTQ